MKFYEVMLLALQITAAVSRRRNKYDSDESIENLLYYKDCKRERTTLAPIPPIPPVMEPMTIREPVPPPPPAVFSAAACPCPKMCCSMCCECDSPSSKPQSPFARQPIQSNLFEPMNSPMLPNPPRQPGPMGPIGPVQPQIMQRNKKRKIRPKIDAPMLPPIGGRRDLTGLTRDKLRSLIAKDDDIKRILKDLVRVTMTKVDMKNVVQGMKITPNPPVQRKKPAPARIEVPEQSEDEYD